jgi:Ca2+-binding RTX toxin-like protein
MSTNSRKIGHGLERLEDRRLMAYVGTDAQGDLLIDTRYDDYGRVSRSNDVVEVSSFGTNWLVTLNGVSQPFAKSRAWSGYIECYLGDGDDDFWNRTSLTADVEGGSGNDTLTGGWRLDELRGGSGNDLLQGGGGDDLLYGESGYDHIEGGEGADRCNGGTENDTIYGGNGHDHLDGHFGNDTLIGGYGNDVLLGSTGDDKLHGEYDNDILHGEAGNDWLDGYHGNDTYFFDADLSLGSDAVHDSEGGIDTLDFSLTTSREVKVNLADRNQQTVNANHRLTLRVDAAIENLFGGAGSDWLGGNSLVNFLWGGTGSDTLFGDAGNDGLFGGADHGRDVLIGGPGADRFLMPATLTVLPFYSYEDLPTDFAAEDAQPTFLNGYTTFEFGGLYTPATWTDADVLRVDSALNVLHRQVGSTRLLETSTSADLVFVRHGTELRGFNKAGWIHLTNSPLQFGGSDTLLRNYVLHEIGHNWDNENPNWTGFLGLSGWTTVNQTGNPNYRPIVGEDTDANGNLIPGQKYGERWWYRTNASFNSFYAASHPWDDFAEAFSAYFMWKGGWAIDSDADSIQDWQEIPNKIAFLDSWLNRV